MSKRLFNINDFNELIQNNFYKQIKNHHEIGHITQHL